MSTLEITGLYIYPVKSMKGIALKRGQLTPRGLLNDRRWMVVRSSRLSESRPTWFWVRPESQISLRL